MNVMVIGSGGREHALADALYRSQKVDKVYVAPGNYGMQDVAEIVDIAISNHDDLIAFAKKQQVELTIVGPEAVLAQGIVDAFENAGLKIFGPSKAASQIEASKDFAKKLMKTYHIPTAAYATFTNKKEAKAYIEKQGVPIVIKEDGLKAGKGVRVCQDKKEALEVIEDIFSVGDNTVVIEECLQGFEFSLMSFVYHDLVIPMEIAQDHKCAYDGDTGPNTGGMGAYSPVKKITQEIIDEAMDRVMIPAVKGMLEQGTPFVGFLYGGFMLSEDGIKTIEFNARFGDPEAEVILPRLQSDLVEVILSLMEGKKTPLVWSDEVTLGVVMAGRAYPQTASKGSVITGLHNVDSRIFHMGTRYENEHYQTSGGRVLCVVAKAKTIQEAYDKAYQDIEKIKCKELVYRHDIGKKDMEE
ncbi:MAG: phosphoribosylamine--glycine ligase [Breznakia sp.]